MGGGGDDGALSESKDGGCPCIALFCVECNCLMCSAPCIAGHAKICCCELTLKSNCPCISFDCAPCYSTEQGCCEAITKFCCLYLEVQFPPSTGDIGLGFCGKKCCLSTDVDAREIGTEGDYAPLYPPSQVDM